MPSLMLPHIDEVESLHAEGEGSLLNGFGFTDKRVYTPVMVLVRRTVKQLDASVFSYFLRKGGNLFLIPPLARIGNTFKESHAQHLVRNISDQLCWL
jgi:hypothetical protein